jgi:hypothetical protein
MTASSRLGHGLGNTKRGCAWPEDDTASKHHDKFKV